MHWQNPYFVIVLTAILLFYALDLLSEFLNLGALSPDLPKGFEDVYDPQRYQESQRYTRVKTCSGLVQSTVALAVFLAFWWLGGFGWLDERVREFGHGTIVQGLIFVGILQLAATLLSLPFELYDTFAIEQRFGFNKTTIGVFFADRVKSLSLIVVLGGPLLIAIIWVFERLGSNAWIAGWLVTAGSTLLLTYLGPALILPLFHKLKPLSSGELKSAIERMASKCEFPLEEVCEVDGSRRSTKANAFFTGMGKHKKIALYDTLIEKHTVGELVAILAHEIGHYKKKHVLKHLALSILQMGVLFFLLGFFMKNPGLHGAFGVRVPSVYTSLVLFVFLYEPVSKLLSLGLLMLSRQNEFEADAYASDVTGRPQDLIDGLKKLSSDTLSNLTPHPLHVFLNYSHPPMTQRIAALQTE